VVKKPGWVDEFLRRAARDDREGDDAQAGQ